MTYTQSPCSEELRYTMHAIRYPTHLGGTTQLIGASAALHFHPHPLEERLRGPCPTFTHPNSEERQFFPSSELLPANVHTLCYIRLDILLYQMTQCPDSPVTLDSPGFSFPFPFPFTLSSRITSRNRFFSISRVKGGDGGS